MSAGQTKEMSPFYNREFHATKSVAEERLIFRWFQLLERHHMIYNVLNKHDCLRADRMEKDRAHEEKRAPHPVVIQPFHSVTNFYGCLHCGKYHICHLRRETCLLVVDKLDKRKACAYTGQLLPIQDNLEVANTLDERSAEKEATPMIVPRFKKWSTAASSSPSHKHKDKTHIMSLFNETGPSQQVPSLKRARQSSGVTKERCARLVADVYDLSIESISLEMSDDDCDDEEKKKSGSNDEDDDDDNDVDAVLLEGMKPVESKQDYYDEDICIRHAKRQRVEKEHDDDDEEAATNDLTTTTDDKEWILSDRGDGGDDDGEGMTIINGQGTEYENENGEGTHAKNYHNNIRYKNEYYAFLQHAITKQKKSVRLNRYDRFIDVYARDMKEDTPLNDSGDNGVSQQEEETTSEEELTKKKNDEKLSESACEKIESEVCIIVSILLSMDKTKRPHCTLTHSFIQQRLVAYFAALVKNITLLVYQSPLLSKVAMKRSAKNQSQSSKFAISMVDQKSVETPQSDAEYHEFTLCPRKIARSLLLYLFTKTFLMGDSQGYNHTIWSIDKWLRLFVQGDDLQHHKFLADYHRALLDTDNDHDRFCKEVSETAVLVEKCLRFYRFCPLWLRAMVFKMDTPL